MGFFDVHQVNCPIWGWNNSHANHKHVQGFNPTTTTYFRVIHNNNNKHGEKPNNKLRVKGYVSQIPIQLVYDFHEQEDMKLI